MNLRQLTELPEFQTRVENELRRLASENPEFVYGAPMASCYYNRAANGQPGPGCIFGQALAALGWDDPIELSAKRRIDKLFNEYTNFLVPQTWIGIQVAQDRGLTWAMATTKLDLN